jgi:hypothetical protein
VAFHPLLRKEQEKAGLGWGVLRLRQPLSPAYSWEAVRSCFRSCREELGAAPRPGHLIPGDQAVSHGSLRHFSHLAAEAFQTGMCAMGLFAS